ncbi:MAG: leucine-rich repeat domain-containing protein, partial [Clostridia bacterium]|nr:leucine-rich repeat domain-containing protein [Clostridia bacterium]
MKKLGILFVTLLIMLFLNLSASAEEVVDSGFYGADIDNKNISWVLYEDGTLILSGTGEMYNRISLNEIYNGKYDSCELLPLKKTSKVIIESGITSIGKYAFCIDIEGGWMRSGISEVILPDTLESIGKAAFQATSIKEITLPDSLKVIDESAFYNCYYLTKINIPSSLNIIGRSAFYNCQIKNVNMPNSVTNIGDYAFSETRIESITIPKGVTNIGEGTFYCCTSLENITIPDSVINIGNYAFWCCEKLKDVYYTGSEEQWKNITVGYENECLVNANIYYNYKGELPHTHTYTPITTEPTCTTAGVTTFTCSCGETYSEAIPAINHANATTDAGKAPTETEVGYTAGKYCPDCGIWIEGHTEIPKLHSHSYTYLITKTATCTISGIKEYTCECGDTYTETIPATNHANATTDEGKAPTETEVGYTAGKYCPDCKIWLEGHEEIPRLDDTHTHSFSETIIKSPTCRETGLKKLVCACGVVKEE